MKNVISRSGKSHASTGISLFPKFCFTVLFSFICVCFAFGQSVYVNSKQGIFQLTGGIGSSHRTLIDNGCGADTNTVSIAVYKDTIYYNTWSGELKRFKIGVPGSCETLIDGGPSYNAMTVDKNGIIYMAQEELAMYDPHTRRLTNLGRMPYFSAGDILFYKDKLLLSGYDPQDWSTGIFEINIHDLSASSLFMYSPPFIGLLSYPVACSNNRYFGLFNTNSQNTQMMELDLVNKKISGTPYSIPANLLDAASTTENGLDDGIVITNVTKKTSDNCSNSNGSISITASSANSPFTFTLLNSGLKQSSGHFASLRGGLYNFRITNVSGCIKDTSIALAENIGTGCNDIFIPTAFTPNGDGKNDLYSITIPAFCKDAALQIFNRWGTEVYRATGSNIAWDGNYKATPQPTGVYVYTIIYTDQTGSRKNLKGTFTLIR